MAYTDTIRALTGAIRNLDAKDAEFARSLIRSVESRGYASEKQQLWLTKMLQKATGTEPPTSAAVGDLGAVYAMFETAKAHLKRPAVVLGWSGGELRIHVAGERSRFPGALQVTDENSDAWWGRVHQNGTFEMSRRTPPPADVTAALQRFAADPIKVAAEHGHLTGKCCFCNRALTDPKSTAVGYGPTCAAHFGLAWGSKAAEAAQKPVLPLGASTVAETAERPLAPQMRAADDDGPAPEDMAERLAASRAWDAARAALESQS